MQTEVIAARMTPVGEVFERFPRLVRDLARDLGKQIRFDMEGEEIELDRSILDEIGDPLLHLIRNAADHGIEPPERAGRGRQAGGGPDPPLGRARAEQRALRVTDDGRGIDRAAILAKARREGAGRRGGRDADATTCCSGCSPARASARRETVSGVSGRGSGSMSR